MNITPLLQAVAALLATIITVVAVPYIKSRTTASQQAQINEWVRIAVSAAEQIYSDPGKGEKKKAYVLKWLHDHGVTVDEAQLDAMIEAAVYELKGGIIPISTGVLISEGGKGNGN